MHTDSGMTGISLSGYMPYMTVASLEMSDEPKIFFMSFYFLLLVIRKTTNIDSKKIVAIRNNFPFCIYIARRI